MAKVLWRPQERQKVFLGLGTNEGLYGGAAGGGKSDALLVDALRQVKIPHYRGIVFRKTAKELSDLESRAWYLYKGAYPRAKYNSTKMTWRFPDGAKVDFGFMQRDSDVKKYQGKAYDFIGFDELTHFTWSQYSYMLSRNRPVGPGTFVCMRAATNPGGVGHAWTKTRFVANKVPEKVYWQWIPVPDENGKVSLVPMSRSYVPAKVFDNHILMKNDPMYVARLSMLDQKTRDALLNGSWDSFSGQAFMEFKNDFDHYKDRSWTHVIDPFPIPDHWKRYRSLDWGYSKPFSIGYWAVDEDGIAYRYKELYGCRDPENEPDTGVRMTPEQVREKMKQIEEPETKKGIRFYGNPADPAIFASQDGKSIASQFAKLGIYWTRGDHTRIAGKMQLHNRLAFDWNGKPMLYAFSNCRNFIRTIPSLVYDDINVEDIDTTQEDHIYDETRYFLMTHIIKSRKNYLAPNTVFDPLSTNKPLTNEQKFMQLY